MSDGHDNGNGRYLEAFDGPAEIRMVHRRLDALESRADMHTREGYASHAKLDVLLERNAKNGEQLADLLFEQRQVKRWLQALAAHMGVTLP